ncbi:hypothetical protein GJ744_010829 [Endocarpon pusillum]|uniref:ZZ-type domain-containing protein n=1 Tax=Endocarpon pusillum TaxID=364733 RepID=A0A8H7E2N1_9EURO|nr:hypothetical protein GJ744_010829 [Endocarpon pusillum]
MHLAARDGHLEVVKLLLDRADVNVSSNEGWTPMHLAARDGHLEVVKLLLDRADVNVSSNEGWTPMHLAAQNGHLEVIKLLLNQGADVKVSNNEGCTPLYWAAYNGNLEVIKLLLDRGADATVLNDNEHMSLHSVAPEESFELPEIPLLSRSSSASQSRTADRGVISMNLLSSPLQTSEEPLSSTIDVNALDGPYGTIVHTAAYKGHLKMLQMLVERYNADIIVTDQFGRSLLHVAAGGGNIDCVNYLLDRGLRCSDKDNDGNDVFHYACSGASIKVVRRILELDPPVIDSFSTWTPLHWACRTGDGELIQLLLSHGFRTSSVHTKIPSASWTPMSIGVFHRNPNSESDIHQSVLEGKKDHGSSYKGFFPSSESSLVVRGSHHAEIWCNKCFHYIYGTRFRCQDCVDFDLCFMCMLTEKPHPGHSWEEIESEEP